MRNSASKVGKSYPNWQGVGLFILWLVSLGLVASIIDESIWNLVLCLGIFVIFSAWGHVIIFSIHYKNRRIVEGFVWGTISGVALTSLITSVIVYITGWNLMVIFGSVTVLPAVVLFVLIRKVRPGNVLQTARNLDTFDGAKHQFLSRDKKCCSASMLSPSPHHSEVTPARGVEWVDLRILLGALIVVTLFFYFPFKNLGALVDGKYLYAWLFGHDFINRMVQVNSLSSGLPLNSFFFAGENLSYYWVAYIYPALIHNLNWIHLDLKQILQVTQVFYSLVTVAGLTIFLYRFVHQRRLLIIMMFLALCCYSYVGLLTAGLGGIKALHAETSLNLLGYDLTRFSGFSHGFYRFFLVEPQATLAIAIILMIFSFYDKKEKYYEFIVIGLLLGLLFGVEATNGIMMILWFIGMSLLMVYTNRGARYSIAKKHLCTLVCGGLICLVLFAIEMYSLKTGQGVLKLAVNWFPVTTGPFYFVLAYGPPLLLGIACLYEFFKQREHLNHFVYQYLFLFLISIFFVFFITNPTELHFGLLKATRIIPICLLVFSAYLFQKNFQTQKLSKIVIVLMLLGLPTLFTDNFIASDISHPSTYVLASDMEAARWIKTNLPKGAIIQAEPNYPGPENGKWPIYAYSFIPIFAERRTAIGEWKVSSVTHNKMDGATKRFHQIKEMFSTDNLSNSLNILKAYNIEYVYIGELEKKLYPKGIRKYHDKNLFTTIYSSNNVEIFRYRQFKKAN